MWRFRTFLLVVMLAASVRAEIMESPENQVVLVNTTVIMKCRTNSTTKPLVWSSNGKGSEPESIFDGNEVNPTLKKNYSVTPDAGRYYLRFKEATPQRALKFKCTEPSSDPVDRSATLVVLESDPKFIALNTSNPEYIDIACSINVSGNWIPMMIWRANGIQELILTNHTKRPSDPYYTEVTSTLYNVQRKDAHKYVCDTFFVPEMHDEDVTARNVPSYKFTGSLQLDLPPSTLASTVPPMAPTPIHSNSWRIACIVLAVLGSISIVVIIIACVISKSSKECQNDHCGYTRLTSCLNSGNQDPMIKRNVHVADPLEQSDKGIQPVPSTSRNIKPAPMP